MPQKIIVCGFPHGGTSILKSIIGHIEEVEEWASEHHEIPRETLLTDKKYAMCKWPFANDILINRYETEDNYKDYIIIFIMRNPLYVFSSLNKRLNYEIPECHGIEIYAETAKKFLECKKRKEEKIYTIRYEDMFENNYRKLRELLDNIGMKYKEEIFDNTKYDNRICPFLEFEYNKSMEEMKRKKPEITEHALYRTWQINQPFVSNNEKTKLDLKETQKEEILNNPYILELYPEIKSTI